MINKPMKRIVAVMSGGLDCLGFLALHTGCEVSALTFSYGQKSQKELEAAKNTLSQIPCIKEHKIIDITFLKDLHSDIQLLDDDVKVEKDYDASIVVPLRNAIFATIATSYAYAIEADAILMGAHMDDIIPVNGDVMFPDCKPEFYESLETSLHIGHFRNSEKVIILTPSMLNLNKNDLVGYAKDAFGELIFDSWSCYNNGDVQCGTCFSCIARRESMKANNIIDKTIYQNEVDL